MLTGSYAVPGFTDISETVEREFTWGPHQLSMIAPGRISGAVRDTGNTPTTYLRPGLLLAQDSTGAYVNYVPAASDATGIAKAILTIQMRANDYAGNDSDRWFGVFVHGLVKASKVIGLDQQARRQLSKQFLFDDDFQGNAAFPYDQQVAKTGNYTVVAADNGKLFTTTGAVGAVTFTLPTLANGLIFGFLNTVDQVMTVQSAAGDDIVTIGDASADSVAFSTVGQMIGGYVEVFSNSAATKWYVRQLSTNAITVAT